MTPTRFRFASDQLVYPLKITQISVREKTEALFYVQAAHKVDLYPIQVAFEYLASGEERNWFKNLPTSFELPRETIDRLRAAGRRLLSEDPQFQNLLKALNGCLAGGGRAC